MEAELPVGVPGRREQLPAVDVVAGPDELWVALVADERRVDRARPEQLLRDVARHAVTQEPVRDPLRPARVAPDELALGVVQLALEHRRAGQLGEVRGRADVVGMEVRDDDPGHLEPSSSAAQRSAASGRPRPVSTIVAPSSPGST